MDQEPQKLVTVHTTEGKITGSPKEVFFSAYEQKPRWEIDRPQRFVIELLEEGWFKGRILDLGCGTGENSIYLKQQGLEVEGFDLVPKAIEQAKAKAASKNLSIPFSVNDVLKLEIPKQLFDVVLDSGVFHVFGDKNRIVYEEKVREQTVAGGILILACFSEHQPGTDGPRRVTQSELNSCLDQHWQLKVMRPTIYETLQLGGGGAKGWLSVWKKR